MKTLIFNFKVFTFILVLSILAWPSCNDDDTIVMYSDNSRKVIDSLKSELGKALSCPLPFILSTADNYSPGEFFTRSECGDLVGIHNYGGNLANKFPTQAVQIEEIPISGSRKGTFNWIRDEEASIGFKIVDYAIEAALSVKDKDIQRLTISFDFNEPKIVRLEDPTAYKNIIVNSNKQLDGNIYITEIVKSKFKMEYTAFDKDNREINIDLSTTINGLADSTYSQSGNFVKTISQENNTYLLENGENVETIIAVCYENIPSNAINDVYVNEKRLEFCSNPNDLITTKNIDLQCNDSLIALVVIEESANRDKWLVTFNNLTEEAISFYKISIIIRNSFGQFIHQREAVSLDDIAVNGKNTFELSNSQIGFFNKPIPKLSELSIEIELIEIKFTNNPFDNFCL